jgi:AraC-like DNA-binding protein
MHTIIVHMLNIANIYTNTTEISNIRVIVDDAMRSLQISGSLLLLERYAPPWAVAVPGAIELRGLLGLDSATRVVAFHLVEFGHCEIKPEGAEKILLGAGDVAIFFGGAVHRISVGKPTQTQEFVNLLTGQNARHPDTTGQPVGTSLICGAFLLHHTEFNPLLSALPPVLHASLALSGELHNLSGVARLLTDEIKRTATGSSYVIERLLEVLCAEAVRAHIEAAPRQELGWFRGLKDPVVGRAIAAIHAKPGEDWSVHKLADRVSMSPSRFAARFAQALGDSPMAYVTKWRMNVACRKLATSRTAIDQIATDVGYESHAAFNRAFKKLVGLPPAAWRTRTSLQS